MRTSLRKHYKKPPVFDAVKKALNPNTGFVKGLYGHGVGRNAGIFSRGAASNNMAQGASNAKVHALRGIVIGGNIVTAGLINIIFAIHSAAHVNKANKAAARTKVQNAIRAEVRLSAGNFGLDSYEEELIEMINYRFGFQHHAPPIWSQGKSIVKRGGNYQGYAEERAFRFYHGYTVYESFIAEVLQRSMS